MNNPVTVSIVINNYNYGRFLGEAIDSALAQTYPNVEVIVVDDGSTDNSRAVIESYGSRVQAVYKENGGQASAFNAGFAASTGDLVQFLDSDDALLPEAAETVVSAWRPRAVRAYFPLEVVDEAGRPLGRRTGAHSVPNPRLGPFGVESPTSGNVFSRTALERIMPVPESRRICADACLTAASSLVGDVFSLERPLAKYRVHGSNNVAGAATGLAEVRRAVRFTLDQYEHLRRIGDEEIGPLETWLSRYPQHWVGRMTSLRESPQDHPWPDTLSGLLRRAVNATWRQPYWNARRKLAYTAFIIAYAGLPKKLARSLKRIEDHPNNHTLMTLLGRKPTIGSASG